MGLLGRVLGVLPAKAMERANACGFGLIAVIAVMVVINGVDQHGGLRDS